ncbi:MAG: GDP-mannose 4,6-dehydratase, partial [Myxococcales bacterium]|nr:GDP-mannose 4,6-dehydratase [Myxococcales bacterium]
GAAGFIGSHLVDAYLAAGHEVLGVDDLSSGRLENVNPKAAFEKLDIRERDRLIALIRRWRPEVVNHHAAQVRVPYSVDEPVLDATINVLGTLHVLEGARAAEARRIVYASTGGAIYGNPRSLPVNEDHPTAPESPYAVSKLAGEHYVRVFSRLHDLASVILRYPNVYGPRQNPKGEAGVVAIFAEGLLAGEARVIFGDGHKTRDYLHVHDVARANVLALERGAGHTLNLGWGREIRDAEVYAAVRDALGSVMEPEHAPRRPGEIERIALDAGAARRELGWEATIPFEDGVRGTVAYYRDRAKS